jgi:outer membrane lipoprotein-sorting protein
MLWRFEEPKGEYLLSDGKSFYYYQPQQKQVLKRPLKGAFRSDIPLSFMLGLGNIERDFNGLLKRGEKGEHVLSLFPKGEEGGFGNLVLGVDPQSYDVIWAQIKDAVGGIISVRFSDIKRGVGLKDSLFRPEIPGGVDVVELGQ